MSEYKMFMGKDSIDLFDALLKHQFRPTDQTKKTLDELQAKNHQRIVEMQIKAESDFISLYGQDIFDFVQGISKENFLATVSKPYSLSWEIKFDSDNDDYWSVGFFKGHFNYVKDICGGYGGRDILEANISIDRVKELLSTITPSES